MKSVCITLVSVSIVTGLAFASTLVPGAGQIPPESLFTDGFEPGDTSAWSWTEPPVTLEILSPAPGAFVGDPRPAIELVYGTITGVDPDPSLLTLDAAASPWTRPAPPRWRRPRACRTCRSRTAR